MIEPATASPGLLNRLRQLPASVRWGTAIFLIGRLGWWAWGVLVMALVPAQAALRPWMVPAAPAPGGPLGRVLEAWYRWDALWYVRIAVEGYSQPDGRGAYSPLLPLLINLGQRLTGNYVTAGVLAGSLAGLAAFILLCELAERDGLSGARAGVLLLSFPMAFFLFVTYTEVFLLALGLAAYLAARGRHWWLAAVLAALAALVKVNGLLLLLPLAWEAWAQRRGVIPWQAAWLAAPPLAALGWVLIRQSLLGQGPDLASFGVATPLLSADFQVEWPGTALSWPWQTVTAAIAAPYQLWPHIEAWVAGLDLALTVLCAALTALTFRLRRPAYALYSSAILLAVLVLITRGTPLIDAPRRLLAAFPIFIAAAAYLGPRARMVWIVVGLLVQLVLGVLFVKWIMVG